MNDEELKDPFLDDASEDEDVDIDGDMDDADGTDDDDDMWDSEEKE